jgi:hypothetical protein
MDQRNLPTGEGPTGSRMLASIEQVFHSSATPSRLMLTAVAAARSAGESVPK